MTLLQLQVFLTVVDTGSFTKAGEKLALSQSGVSHTISGLEAELGVTLLVRNRNGIKLTEVGEELLVQVREIINRTEQLKQIAAASIGLQKGTLKIGSFPSVSAKLLPGIISSFQNRYPGIQITLLEGSYQEIHQWILACAVDLGFITVAGDEPNSVPLVKDELVAVVPASHSFCGKQSISLGEIATEPFIMPKAGCDELVEAAFEAQGMKPRIVFEVVDTATILTMVQEGLGITIVPSLTLPDRLAGVTMISLAPKVYRQIGLGISSHALQAPAVTAFVKEAQAWISRSDLSFAQV